MLSEVNLAVLLVLRSSPLEDETDYALKRPVFEEALELIGKVASVNSLLRPTTSSMDSSLSCGTAVRAKELTVAAVRPGCVCCWAGRAGVRSAPRILRGLSFPRPFGIRCLGGAPLR